METVENLGNSDAVEAVESVTLEPARIKSIVESVLFVARKPLSVEQLEEVLELSRDVFQPVLDELLVEYQSKGLTIFPAAGGYLMGTIPENADYVQKILRPKVETTLTPTALETLAIIAYKQPVTRGEVERVRGVNSDYVMDTLISKRLIKEAGRSEAIGHPYLYVTSEDFLRHFGLKDISELPPLPFDINEEPIDYKAILPEELPQAENVELHPPFEASTEPVADVPVEQPIMEEGGNTTL